MKKFLLLAALCLLSSVQPANAIVSPDDPNLAHSENAYVQQRDGQIEKMNNTAESRDDAKAPPKHTKVEDKPQTQEKSPE